MDDKSKAALGELARAQATIRLASAHQPAPAGAVRVALDRARGVIEEGGGNLEEFVDELREIEAHLVEVAPR